MKKNLSILVTIMLLGAIGWYVYSDLQTVDSNVSESTNATTTLNDLGIDFEGEGITVEEVPIEAVKQPVLNRAVVFPESFSPEAQEIMKKKLADVIAILKQDQDRLDKWMEYGSLLNTVNDYEGAREVWEYAKIFIPNDPVVYANLGFLYGYDLKNIPSAEENYLLSIKVAPRGAIYYTQTAQFYIDVVKDNAKALSIIKRGLEQIPQDKNLQAFKIRLEK